MTGGRHIGINAVFLAPNMGGIDTYVRGLLPALLESAPEHRFSVFCSAGGRRHLSREPWADAVELVTHPMLGVPGLRAVSEMTLLELLARRRRVDVLDSLAMTGPLWPRMPHVVTIHDVIWMELDDDAAQATYRLWRRIVPRIVANAERVIAVSEAAKADIVRLLGVPGDRVDVTYQGAGLARGGNVTPEAELRKRLGIGSGPIVLNVSTKKRHKNLERLVRAMPAVLARFPEARLVIPGNPTQHEAELRRLAEEIGVVAATLFPPFLPRQDLEGLYAAAACFVFPSTHEGFGHPVLEAMVRGVPVACSTSGPLPEVAGTAARYFDPFATDEMGRAICELLGEPSAAAALAEAGRSRARRFTWERCAEQTLASLERAWAR